jgi:predicted amidohydrolase
LRLARITSISLPGMGDGPDRLDKVLERASTWIDLAAGEGPDLICLPESVNGLGLGGDEWARTAEEVPGPTTRMASEKAAEHSAYLVCPLVRRDARGIHNSATLYDRDGELVGVYDKVHPTMGELECGVVPGRTGLVSRVDFGRIGFAICFDLNFRDLRDCYADEGIDILLFPSMFRGGLQLRAWAYELGCYLVSATPGEQSAIVNPLGRTLAESQISSGPTGSIISLELNLDYQVMHLDYNSEKLAEVKRAFGTQVRIEVAGPEGIFLLSSRHPERDSASIAREFGMETRHEYFRRASAMRSRALGEQ